MSLPLAFIFIKSYKISTLKLKPAFLLESCGTTIMENFTIRLFPDLIIKSTKLFTFQINSLSEVFN